MHKETWQIMLDELRSTGMTLEFIGNDIGVGRSAVCKLIKGAIRPSVMTYQAIERMHQANRRQISRAKRQAKG